MRALYLYSPDDCLSGRCNYTLYSRNLINPNTVPNFRDRFYDDVYTFGVRWFY